MRTPEVLQEPDTCFLGFNQIVGTPAFGAVTEKGDISSFKFNISALLYEFGRILISRLSTLGCHFKSFRIG
ncbi:hypothetical protein GJAV_G00137490 [Gymnothorax javanicus]|nr:hypothetical protein GJAV_G00137490 [Gymnothorax javanicus]